MSSLAERLSVQTDALADINRFLLDPSNPIVQGLLSVVEKYGTPEEINAKAAEARRLPNLLEKLRRSESPYLVDLEWLAAERDRGAFVNLADYRRKLAGDAVPLADKLAVTLEISALQYFPWLIAEARQAIERQ
jgi:hypothetical protein